MERASRDSPGRADRRLVRRARAGDPAAIERLVARLACVPRFLTIRSRRSGPPLPAEDLADLTQDVVAAVWSRLDSYRGDGPLETWVRSFCLFALSNHRRRTRSRRRVDPRDLLPRGHDEEESRPDPAVGSALRSALANLRPGERCLLERKLLRDEPFARIAACRSTSIGAVKGRYYRALERLRRELSKRFGRDGDGALPP